MSLPNLKELKKISEACRKAGIATYKCADFEITLTDTVPVKTRTRSARKFNEIPTGAELETDDLTDEQRLFYSVQDTLGIEEFSS